MKLRLLYIVLLFIGVLYRLYFQFLSPVFNVDEISLGNNIKELGYLELLFPLNYGQSSPPLFLWLQKIVVETFSFPFWINIKVISLIVSVLGLIYFYKFIVKKKCAIVLLLPFIILLFNPFVIYNSLTLKQYTFDLLGVIMLIYYFDNKKFKYLAPLFFLIWSLISNVGCFGCVGYLLFLFIKETNSFNKFHIKNFWYFIKKHALVFISLLPYTLYFFWFMRQEGAIELQNYMKTYWSSSFIPFDFTLFKFILIQIHGFWIFFYNAIEIIGVFFFVIAFIPLILQLFKRKKIYLQSEILLLGYIFCVHIILSAFKIYPLSDRLYLYLILFFVLILSSSLMYLSKRIKIEKYYFTILFSIICFCGYIPYINYKDNDVNSVLRTLKKLEITAVYVTPKAEKTISNFNDFTNYAFKTEVRFLDNKNKFKDSEYLLSRVHNKLKPNRTSREEAEVVSLINKNKLFFFKEFQGFNLYKIKQ